MNQSSSIISVNKQRGVYSEIIIPDNSQRFVTNNLTGPDESLMITTQLRQNVPKATGLKFKKAQQENYLKKSLKHTSHKLIQAIAEQNEDYELSVDPKVMQPYDPVPGRVPRKVAIDRKKKQYASYNIQELLNEKNIDFNDTKKKQCWLPLQYFDDNTYDDYTDEDWISRKIDQQGISRRLTGKGLRKVNNLFQFQRLQVLQYLPDRNLYQIQWRKDQVKEIIHRIYFCFDAQDPRKYVSRVKNAFQERIYADSIIRYQFYIDNMPIHNADLPELDQQQKKRLQNLAKNKKLKDMESTAIIMQVGYDYNRTMNKIIFNDYLSKFSKQDDENYPDLILPRLQRVKQSPYYGMIELQRHKGNSKQIIIVGKDIIVQDAKDFTQTFKNFCFHSLFIKKEVIKALQEIRVKCNQVLSMELFDLNKTRNRLVLQQFRHKQESSISQMLYTLKGSWIQQLIKVIKTNFTDVGKGWFNMQQTSKITYDFGKLKRFLTVVRLIMQDSLLYVVRKSYYDLRDYIFSFIPHKIHVINACQATNQFVSQDEIRGLSEKQIQKLRKKKYMQPLFLLDLVKAKQDQFSYSTSPASFVNMIVHLFQKPLEDVAKIPDLEPKILSDLYKAIKNQTFIKAPMKPREKPVDPDPRIVPRKLPDQNKWIWDIIQQVRQKLEEGIKPLYEYKKSWDEYLQLLKLDPDEFTRKIEMQDNPWEVQQIQMEIAQIIEKDKRLREKLPQKIQISFFEVNCKEMKETLSQKHQTLQKNFIDMIAKRARQQSQAIFNEFQMIQNKIREHPNNIEKLTDLKEYITNLPNQMQKIKVQMHKCFEIYKILEDFNYRFSKDQLDKRWIIFGSPKQIRQMVEKRQKQLDKDKVKFLDEMKVQQQDFKESIDNLERTIQNFHSWQDIKAHQTVAKSCIEINKSIQTLIEDSKKFNSRQALFDIETTDYKKIQEMNKQFTPYNNLWVTADQWFTNNKLWMNGDWQTLDAVSAQKFVEQSVRILGGVNRFFKQRDVGPVLKIAQSVKSQIDQFKPKVPLMVALRKKGMVERHWKQISQKVGFQVFPTEGFTFSKALEMGLMKYVDICVDIGERASKQYNIQVGLNSMQAMWENINFTLLPYKNTFLIRNYDEIQIVLDQHMVNTQSMQFSPFKKPFEEQILIWNNKLKTMSDVLEEWAKCQGEWMYLQPIFDSADIAKQLPNQSKKFKTVDSTWRHTMDQASKGILVLQMCSQQGLLERLQQANKNLQTIQKELKNYLQKKRQKFARFYFLSDSDLLEILSQTKEPTAVQPHLRKVFENINQVEFDKDKKILSMSSSQKQKVKFVKNVDPNKKNVEDWMGQLQQMMRSSVRSAFLNAVKDYPSRKRTEWAISHPGQVILNGSQIVWTGDVEQAFRTGGNAVKEYWDKLYQYLLDLVELVRTKLSVQAKVTINALIVIDVHAKDVVQKLWRTNVHEMSAFQWISQLRYYWENDNCYVKCIQTNFPYGYQYLGNTLRLVITPLTDKCYMTLMGALKLNLGGAPAGPAGTGKTQSVKDLAKALAKQCVVFNCSDSMDYIMIGKFFKGLASAGAWCCFDQFNRINIQVLSVIAQQLLVLFGQKAKGTPIIQFQDSVIKLLPTFSVFITMNPGYAGRTQLPDNLKALFRAMAMMVPDYAMIGQIMLYSFGFTQGRALAQKMVATFKLSSEQLSSQDHYDYGMRAVRSVINAAGLLKSAEPDLDQSQLLLRALRDVNVPKFLKDDLPLFENIIKDLFPGIEKPHVDYGLLLTAIKNVCKSQILQPAQVFIDKILQLYDTIQVRHGLMLVGPTGGGKTSDSKVLSLAMTSLEKQGQAKVHLHTLNPKSIKIPSQLYGDYNQATHQWSDGILAYTVRECVKDTTTDKHWIMFDGPVDALWIQSMNTVLDDNKKLCLNSGQILTLTPHMTMMFEVEDLAVASPATVSRCGMVYMQPQALGIEVLFQSWFQKIPENIKSKHTIEKQLRKLVKNFVDPTLKLLRTQLKEVITTMDNNLSQSLMRIINCFLVLYTDTQIKKITPEQMEYLDSIIQPLFVFSFIWSFCCTVDYQSRIKLDLFVKQLIKNHTNIDFPQSSIYDYFYNQAEKKFIQWSQTNSALVIDTKMQYHQIMIPTMDSARNIYFLKLLITNQKHVMNVGPTGTGKSLNINQLLTKQLGDDYQYISMVFSAQTGCNQTQDTIDGKLDKRRKGVYGPPIGKKFVIFVDDLNMPKKQQFGAQPPIQLLRQYLDHKGWYNRKDLTFMKLEQLILLSAMGPPGGGRTFITARLIRHFNVIAYTQLNENIINSIFVNLVNNFYKRYSQTIRNVLPKVIENVIQVYDRVRKQLLPTPSKSHYTFNLRDMWRVFQGICSASPKYIQQVTDFLKLWYHENMRVFHDRLTTEEDRKYMKNLLGGYFKDFGYEKQQILNVQRLIYGDFTQGRDTDNKPYIQIQDLSSLVSKMDSYQQEYNQDIAFIIGGPRKQMKLVMFLDACEHISRIARIIRQPQGNALVLGVGGSGRQSLSRMATYLTGYKLFQIEVIKNYNMRTWRDDIKKALMLAGIQNKPISFLFCDTQIINEQMLQDINNILNSGDVTGIYQQKDMEEIITACKGQCVRRNIPPTKMNIFTQFLIRVKKNIHMIIAMSPLGQLFTNRLRMFPSLINCSTIDWFTQWPEQALIGVGKGQLVEFEQQLGIQGKIPILVEMFKTIHKSVQQESTIFLAELRRHNYVTPTSYLELLNMYKQILGEKRKQLKKQVERLKTGLGKLQSANKQVEEMKVQLKLMQPQLQRKNLEVGQLLQSLTKDQNEAQQQQKIVSFEQAEATRQSNKAKALADQQQKFCADAQKSLDETLQQVKLLKKDHLLEIKTFSSPSEAVKTVSAGLVILFWDWIVQNGGEVVYYANQPGQIGKKQENYFEMCKRFLMKDLMGLIKMIEMYDKNSIPDKAISKLNEKVIHKPQFDFDQVAKSSFAAKFLQMWIKSMFQYNQVYKKTQPLRKELAILKATVEQKQALLRKKKEQLEEVNNKIELLMKKYNESMKQQQQLKTKIQQCQIKLQRAQKLTEGLSQEKTRWAIDIKNLQKKIQLISGDSVISAGMVAYSGPFTSQYREKLQKIWSNQLKIVGLDHTPGINMREFLGDPVKIQAWNIAQLPKDDNSTQNGIIIDKARRWPLMIDPQNQANKFIKNLSKQHQQGIDVVKVTDPNLMRTIELAVQYGRWVLLQNVQRQLDPSLQPILAQQVVKSGGSQSGIIQIGDKSLAYNNSFKFYMTTTMPNPHYSPQTFVKVTIINFAITPNGLEEQMLAQIVSLQNPNLEQKKTQIVKKNAADKKELLNIEDSILKSLSQTKGGINEILMDETLINKLQSSKKFAAQINQRVKDSKITEAQIDKARQSYRPVAYRSSLLYFCILDLSLIDPMYQYSLQWFTNLFMMGVQNAPASNVLEERLKNMNDYFTYSLYQNICRSLFEKHKLLFSFLLTIKILAGDKNLDEAQFRFFLAGPSGEIKLLNNPTTWISQNIWSDVYRQLYTMSTTINNFKGIDQFFLQKSEQFKSIFDSPNAHTEKYPQYWEKKLTQFQKIIFLKALRPDKVIPAIQLWITDKMGQRFIIAPTFELAKCYKDSTIVTPLIFVLSPGSDPVADFLRFAQQQGMGKRIDSISLGQGQGAKAQKLVRQCSQKGTWVLLQNCHLAVSWMPQLEKLVEQLNENMHKDFRLWLTSMPTPQFPISVLQNGVKMTIQPPQGLRANLLRTYTNLSDQQLKDCKKPDAFKKLLFGFCLFHAIIQDRRKFGPIGWNIAYQFTNQDLTVCKKQLKMLLDQYDQIPYKVINFLGAQINYGGRVTDDKDVRLIKTILKNYISDQCLRDGYKYSESGHYISIPAGNLQSYLTYIQTLPLNPAPQAFGLHDNAQITNAQNQTINLLENVLSVQPRTSSGSGKSRQQVIEQIVLFIEKRTPKPWDIDQIYSNYPTNYNQSMNTVLIQQLIRYNRLLQIMAESIKNSKKALKGLIVMSEELQKMCNALFDNQVPTLWADKGFLSLKPLSSWINDLVQRVTFLQKWIDNGTPSVFWISGFFFPQAFVTGTLQNFARKYVIAIDKIGLEFRILDNITYQQIKQKPQDGCYVYGIFLQGARWDSKRHMITLPKPKELYSDLPLIHILPVNNREAPTQGIYNCPMYKVVSRRGTLSTTGHSTNFVLFMQLPTKESEDAWIKGGVAAFLSLRY